MKPIQMLSAIVVAVLVLTACGSSGSTEPAAGVTGDRSHEVDMEVLISRRYQALQAAEALRIAQVSEP
jgi:hypothetical protein